MKRKQYVTYTSYSTLSSFTAAAGAARSEGAARKTAWKRSPEPLDTQLGAQRCSFEACSRAASGLGVSGAAYFGHGGQMSNYRLNLNTGHAHSHEHQRSPRPLKGELGGSQSSILSRNYLGPLLPDPYAGIHSASDFLGQFGSHCWGLAAGQEVRVTVFRGAFAIASVPATLQPAFPLRICQIR